MIDVIPETCIYSWLSEPCEDCSFYYHICSIDKIVLKDISVSLLMRVSTYFNP